MTFDLSLVQSLAVLAIIWIGILPLTLLIVKKVEQPEIYNGGACDKYLATGMAPVENYSSFHLSLF
ncbi:hypothetical protein CA267_017855 [Alteromonas pelagimontana]|uniref:Uncharacterized protein n=1 Tax=Alteromonas pelagimontana TaxID=1858656 RepID=A0A6M4MK80_9ALTE|nr:hypothetical protein CA267_017855 [Alteromonas pelagimontana]